ncbi:MAG: hypothetical protein IKL40_03765 [Clostridia bacterium]|nr:hypothetical protein [Clostridia bacterium]
MEKEMKLSYGIKGKLISATAMLLVAVIMVVSSTYAWFTLSTAPEVTSISTAVGANGALEIVLNNGDIQTGALPAGIANTAAENYYWGNLINLGFNDEYGTDKIVLNPSELKTTADGKVNIAAPVVIPEYNAGGRVTGTTEDGTGQCGTYDKTGGNFFASNDTGFRAIGVASGLSARQKAFNNAVAAIVTAQGEALVDARTSLSENGTTLAAIAVRHAMTPTATYTPEEVGSINNMIAGLTNSVKKLETAYLRALMAVALSSENTTAANDDAAIAAAAVIEAHIDDDLAVGVRLENALTESGLSAAGLPGYTTYENALTALRQASTIDTTSKTEFEWNDISTTLHHLVNTDSILINGKTVEQVKTDDGKKDIAQSVTSGEGILVKIPTNGGIYADVADLCEDYTVEITINAKDVTGSDSLDMDVKARMQAASDGSYKYLTATRTWLNNKQPASTDSTEKPLTEFYGYVIDLGFKTNAAQSNLLLQYEAKDRIYADNENEATMGGGSTMTFTTADVGFTNAQVRSLMKKIRVVFFDTTTDEILANAKLDVDHGTTGADGGVTAYIKLVDENGAFIDNQAEAVITGLDQNIAKYVSALVYLDGAEMTNADVAATKATSLTGTVNIQFASSATLVPMEYADLHIKNN